MITTTTTLGFLAHTADVPTTTSRPLALQTDGGRTPRPGSGLMEAVMSAASADHAGWAPRLRGQDPRSLASWAIACRASAAVLELEGQPERAADLRRLAEIADLRSRTELGDAGNVLDERRSVAA